MLSIVVAVALAQSVSIQLPDSTCWTDGKGLVVDVLLTRADVEKSQTFYTLACGQSECSGANIQVGTVLGSGSHHATIFGLTDVHLKTLNTVRAVVKVNGTEFEIDFKAGRVTVTEDKVKMTGTCRVSRE